MKRYMQGAKFAVLLDAAMGPLPDEFAWRPWGYELPEPVPSAALTESTQYLSIRDFVLETPFPVRAAARRTGAVL